MSKLPPEKQVVIDSLSRLVAEKRQLVENLGMMNVNGGDEAYRMRLSMQFSQARAELWNAESALRDALLASDPRHDPIKRQQP